MSTSVYTTSVDSAESPRERCTLLGIPRELRFGILRHLLPAQLLPETPASDRSLAIFLVNRAIYEEASELLYNETEFGVVIPDMAIVTTEEVQCHQDNENPAHNLSLKMVNTRDEMRLRYVVLGQNLPHYVRWVRRFRFIIQINTTIKQPLSNPFAWSYFNNNMLNWTRDQIASFIQTLRTAKHYVHDLIRQLVVVFEIKAKFRRLPLDQVARSMSYLFDAMENLQVEHAPRAEVLLKEAKNNPERVPDMMMAKSTIMQLFTHYQQQPVTIERWHKERPPIALNYPTVLDPRMSPLQSPVVSSSSHSADSMVPELDLDDDAAIDSREEERMTAVQPFW